MAGTQHYVWAAGHFFLLLCSALYFFRLGTLKGFSSGYFRAAFTGALTSYAIVCWKSLGIPQPSPSWIARAIADENAQYFLLAFFWWSTQPVTFGIVPYMIFSLFHALTFARTTLLPQILSSGPPATAGGPPTPHPIAKKMQLWVKNNYDPAMKLVAYTELLIFGRLTLGLLFRMNSFLAPIFFLMFLRSRWYMSPYTREAMAVVGERFEFYIRREGVPPAIPTYWDKVKPYLVRWWVTSVQAAPAATPRR